MTEDKWLACKDRRKMVKHLKRRARGTDRVWRLFMAAFWIGNVPLLDLKRDRTTLVKRVTMLEVWAETGAHPKRLPKHRPPAVFLNSDVWEAVAETIRAAEGVAWGEAARPRHVALLRDIFGNPFRPVTFSPSWRTDTAVSLARGMYESRDFSAMPILADALQDAGCDNDDVPNHCRDPKQFHVRGCWVVDLVLGKQ